MEWRKVVYTGLVHESHAKTHRNLHVYEKFYIVI